MITCDFLYVNTLHCRVTCSPPYSQDKTFGGITAHNINHAAETRRWLSGWKVSEGLSFRLDDRYDMVENMGAKANLFVFKLNPDFSHHSKIHCQTQTTHWDATPTKAPGFWSSTVRLQKSSTTNLYNNLKLSVSLDDTSPKSSTHVWFEMKNSQALYLLSSICFPSTPNVDDTPHIRWQYVKPWRLHQFVFVYLCYRSLTQRY